MSADSQQLVNPGPSPASEDGVGADSPQQPSQPTLPESRYRALVRASSELVWTATPEGIPSSEMVEWREFTGQTGEVFQTLEFADAIHPKDRDHSADCWAESISTGAPLETEERLRRHDGVYRTMRVRAVPVRDAHGSIVEWVGTHTDVTEQKSLEQSLRERERQLEEAYRLAGLGCWWWDVNTNTVTWTEEVYRVFERDSHLPPPKYQDLQQYHTPAGWAQLSAAVTKALECGEAYSMDVPLTMQDGRGKWIAVRGEVEAYADGKASRLRGTVQDITERKEAEQALRASEGRFRKLFDSDLMGICIPDRFGAFYEGNDEFLRVVGYSRAELEAGLVRWNTMTPPEYAAVDAAHIAEAAERGSCTPYEKEYIRKDGTRVPIHCGYALLDGSEDTYVGFIQDLTAQKEAEAALDEREQRFSLLAESLPQLIFVADPEGHNTYCNQRLLAYAGVKAGDEASVRWEALIHPDDLASAGQKWRQARQTGEAYLDEHRLRRQDGTYRWFLARAVPLRSEEGTIERWLGSSTDVHDQKLAEEALRRSEKLAATGRLAASVAHEINNPLSSVTNAVYLALQDQSLSETTRNWLKLADEELVRVAHVATQTLRFFRQSTAPTLVDVSQVMDAVLEIFASRLRSFSVQLEKEYVGSEKLYCFSDELRQVFANLIGNALDAMGSGGRLRIRIANGRGWGSTARRGVTVSLADTGSGIPACLRKQVFEPFVSTKGDTGTGLGLWVSQGIARKHGGTIALRSCTAAERHGTVFVVFLPFDGIAQGEARGSASAGPAADQYST